MPPKRKASEPAAAEEPPAKRVTRSSRAPLALPEPDKPKSTRRTRATPAPAAAQLREDGQEEKARPAARGRKPKSTAVAPPLGATNDDDGAAQEPPVARRTRATRATPVPETKEKPQPAPRSRRKRAMSAVPQEEPVNTAEADEDPEPLATRRRTRATAVEEPEGEAVPQSIPTARGRGRGRGRGARVATSRAATLRKPVQPTSDIEEPDPMPVKRRGRLPKVVPLPMLDERATPEPVVEPARATSSRVTIEALAAADDSGSDDELLLTPTKNVPRHVTPLRSIGPRTSFGTPRMILEAVEVPTPSKRLRAGLTPKAFSPHLRFPTVGSPSKLIPVTNRHLPVRATTPTKATPRSSPRRIQRPPSPSEDDELGGLPLLSPSKQFPITPVHTPRKDKAVATPQPSPTRLPRALPPNLHPYLDSQKAAVLKALQSMPITCGDRQADDDEDAEPLSNEVAYEQLSNLLRGTVDRGEGNSCLLMGPKGSGKTQLVERAIGSLSTQPIVIRLSGYAQTNDRLAIREIAWQLAEQTGNSLLPVDKDEEDTDNPFVDNSETIVALPPPSHLLALISMIPTLPRPTVVVIDAFDLFALHARQSLLYCLLDTVQSCRVGAGSKGLAVIGVTPRVDTINMFEKRVKSRFSGRMLRTAGPPTIQHWIASARAALCAAPEVENSEEWTPLWEGAIDKFLQDPQVIASLRETFALTKDVRVLSRILVASVLSLKPTAPYLTAITLAAATSSQRCPSRFPFLDSLTYPAVCLLIAATHARTSGHETFTFEMLHEAFRDQVRTSLSAPVQFEGGGIGMVRCSREVLAGAFERLVSLRVFVATAAPAVGTGREFIKYRCAVDRVEVKKTVDKMGQHNLKKWLNKAQ